MFKTEELNLVKEWDKVFPKSDKVNHSKVVFPNHFGITLAADLYVPKNAGEIDSAVPMVHGEKAHSCYMSRDAFKLLKGENKELLIIPDALHTDLYDGGGKNAIPFDKMESFFKEYLK